MKGLLVKVFRFSYPSNETAMRDEYLRFKLHCRIIGGRHSGVYRQGMIRRINAIIKRG
jgi:hypothetical protein